MSKKLLIFTGAGISADSGISTFRDSNGLWENHNIDKVCNIATWKDNYKLVHSFYNKRRSQLNEVDPNPAHYMCASLQTKYGAQIITQNIDDLHERCDATDVLHVHGNLSQMKCIACGNIFDIGFKDWIDDSRCSCGSHKGVKPAVIFFGENAPHYKKMYDALYDLSDNDILLVIGTSGKVIPIGVVVANTQATTILVNLDPQDNLDNKFKYVIHGRAGELADEIEKMIDEMFNN